MRFFNQLKIKYIELLSLYINSIDIVANSNIFFDLNQFILPGIDINIETNNFVIVTRQENNVDCESKNNNDTCTSLKNNTNKVVLDVSGMNGENYKHSHASRGFARANRSNAGNGFDGLFGQDGQHSGDVNIVIHGKLSKSNSKDSTNGDNMFKFEIRANGGNGGMAQYGGCGADGERGKDGTDGRDINEFSNVDTKGDEGKQVIIIFGKKGTKGQNGGKPGRTGLEGRFGHKGNITIKYDRHSNTNVTHNNSNNNRSIKIECKSRHGSNGERISNRQSIGGMGVEGGRHGMDHVKDKESLYVATVYKNGYIRYKNSSNDNGWLDGRPGTILRKSNGMSNVKNNILMGIFTGGISVIATNIADAVIDPLPYIIRENGRNTNYDAQLRGIDRTSEYSQYRNESERESQQLKKSEMAVCHIYMYRSELLKNKIAQCDFYLFIFFHSCL